MRCKKIDSGIRQLERQKHVLQLNWFLRCCVLITHLISGTSCLFLLSCIPEPLEVKHVPVVKPQIVVNTQIIPGESLVVLLTKTFGALDASDDSDPEELLNQIAVTDAIVAIEGPDKTDTLLYLGSGAYGGVLLSLEEGQSYTLRVVSASLGEVTATTTVKPQVRFEDVEAELYFTGFDDTLAQITYQLQDPVGRNHYMINVQHISIGDPIEEKILNPRAFTELLEDTEFDGQLFADTFRAFPRDYETGDTVAVFLSNISEEYYRFIELRQDTRYGFVEFISEPVNYPTNVTGGRGFFNLYLPDVRLFEMEKIK